MMERLHGRAADLGLVRLFSDVSLTAEPFFEAFGFRTVERKNTVIGQASLANARMEKALSAGISSR